MIYLTKKNIHPHYEITYNNNLVKTHKQHTQHKQLNFSKEHEYKIAEVIDDVTYTHFKTLLKHHDSNKLCHGELKKGKKYKVHISLSQNYDILVKTQNHYKLLYVHNNSSIIAYIAVKLFKKDGGFMFIHKVCSTGGGWGSKLMKMILEDARENYKKLKITYLSLTTHNLELIDYYNQFNPTRVIEIDSPGSKAIIPKRVAYVIWQLSPNMPWYDYK